MRLLESHDSRERHPAGAMVSVVAHAAIIAATVVATARATAPRTPPTPPPVITYVDRRDVPITRKAPSGPASGEGRQAPTGPGITFIPIPPEILPGIPPIDTHFAEPGRAFVVGNARPGGGDAFGTGSPSGTPDADGTWSAHAVEVAVVPRPGNAIPGYPELLRAAGLGGHVLAEFVVDSAGKVREGSLAIVEASHPLFAASVRRTVPSLRFEPARVQGQRVAQRVRMPFEFAIAR